MMHHIIFCLMVAFASQRILLLNQPQEMFGFDNHFMPLSNCTPSNVVFDNIQCEWPSCENDTLVKFCPNKKNKYHDYGLGRFELSIFPYLPKQIMLELELISPDPPVWLIGQFARYVMRPQTWFLKEIVHMKKVHPGN